MECIEHGTADEVLRPDHARGPDQKIAAHACKPKASEGGGLDEEDLEPWPKIGAIVLLRNDDGVHHVRRGDGDIGHHVDQHMLLHVERSRVEGELPAAKNPGQYPGAGGEVVRECLAQRVCNEEHNERREVRCRIAEGEIRVEAATYED